MRPIIHIISIKYQNSNLTNNGVVEDGSCAKPPSTYIVLFFFLGLTKDRRFLELLMF